MMQRIHLAYILEVDMLFQHKVLTHVETILYLVAHATYIPTKVHDYVICNVLMKNCVVSGSKLVMHKTLKCERASLICTLLYEC